MTKVCGIVFLVSRTRVRARLPTAMLIFAVTSVTQRGNFDRKTDQFLEDGKEIEKTFGRVLGVFSVFEIRIS